MKKFVAAILLLASCSSEDQPKGQQGGPPAAAGSGAQGRADSPSGPLTSLTGLYEGGAGERRHQMCVVEGKGGGERFGLVVWGEDMQSCAGSGSVSRNGGTLRLSMAGDSACTIEAKISGKTVKLPATTPAGCEYYCGRRAALAGAELTQVGTARSYAMKAKDIVGDPLCGEL
jgi:hypothetical protein